MNCPNPVKRYSVFNTGTKTFINAGYDTLKEADEASYKFQQASVGTMYIIYERIPRVVYRPADPIREEIRD